MGKQKRNITIKDDVFDSNVAEKLEKRNYALSLYDEILFTQDLKYLADSCYSYWLMGMLAQHCVDTLVFNVSKVLYFDFKMTNKKDGVLIKRNDRGDIVKEEKVRLVKFPFDEMNFKAEYNIRNKKWLVEIINKK